MAQGKDGFYGVYLLVSENPSYAGRTYIGFTVDPHRRLRQHNRGSHAGGAWRTSCRGPWSMALVTHGFPNEVSALRVEWAWQHPESSRRLRRVPRKKSSESRLQYSVRLLGCILRTAPWCALPLTVTWLDQRYYTPFAEDLHPPPHMVVRSCDISALKKNSPAQPGRPAESAAECSLCHKSVQPQNLIRCTGEECGLVSHVVCLGKHFLSTSTGRHPTLDPPPWSQPLSETSAVEPSQKKTAALQDNEAQSQKSGRLNKKSCSKDEGPLKPLLPVDGNCPACGVYVVWGDLVRPLSVACASSRGGDRGKGVFVAPENRDGEDTESEASDDYGEDHWTNLLTQR